MELPKTDLTAEHASQNFFDVNVSPLEHSVHALLQHHLKAVNYSCRSRWRRLGTQSHRYSEYIPKR